MKIRGIICRKKGSFCLETERGDYHLRSREFEKYGLYEDSQFIGKSASAEDWAEVAVPRPVETWCIGVVKPNTLEVEGMTKDDIS